MINEGGFRFARIGIANIPVKRVNAISERTGEIHLYGFNPQAKRVRSHRLRHRIVHRCERKAAPSVDRIAASKWHHLSAQPIAIFYCDVFVIFDELYRA